MASASPHDASQASLLLDLPPELRNLIYDDVARNTDTVGIYELTRQRHRVRSQPLGQVCHQLRQEFRDAYNAEVAQYAKILEINVIATIDRLPACEEQHSRQYKLNVFVENTFNHHIRGVTELVLVSHQTYLKCSQT